jgi:hypothetical protein
VLVRPLSDPGVRGAERLELPAACGSFAAVDGAPRAELERRESHGLRAITWFDALLLVEDRALPRGWDCCCVEVRPAAWGCEAAIDEATRAEEQRRARQLAGVGWRVRQAMRWHNRTPPRMLVQERARRSVLGELHLGR